MPQRDRSYIPERDGPFFACPDCEDSGYVQVKTLHHSPLSMQGTKCREQHIEPWDAMAPCGSCTLGAAINRGNNEALRELRGQKQDRRRPANRRLLPHEEANLDGYERGEQPIDPDNWA